MFRPKITEEMRVVRQIGAKNCLKNLEIYLQDVAYGDTQRFSYDQKGNILLDFGTEKVVSNTILVWGGIYSSSPKASLYRVNGKFDSSSYKNIIQQHILPLTKEPSKRIGLVHDWYPVHRSKSVTEFVAENKNIFIADWPKYFGDLMPVENVWLQMSSNFAIENVKASNEESLWREVSLMWEKVCTDDYINHLFQEFPKKLKKIEQGGGLDYVD